MATGVDDDYCAADDASTNGTNSIDSVVVGDDFPDYLSNDWNIATNADCAGAGTATGIILLTDFDDNDHNTPPDIGAYALAAVETSNNLAWGRAFAFFFVIILLL